MKHLSLSLAALIGMLAVGSAWAGTPTPLPEPGILELMLAGAVAGLVAWVRKIRK